MVVWVRQQAWTYTHTHIHTHFHLYVIDLGPNLITISENTNLSRQPLVQQSLSEGSRKSILGPDIEMKMSCCWELRKCKSLLTETLPSRTTWFAISWKKCFFWNWQIMILPTRETVSSWVNKKSDFEQQNRINWKGLSRRENSNTQKMRENGLSFF